VVLPLCILNVLRVAVAVVVQPNPVAAVEVLEHL
jgi:hypothetical protein